MFNKVTCTAFIICALLLIAVTFHVHGFKDTYDRHINTYDEGWVMWSDANADDTCQASIFLDKHESDWWPWVNTSEGAHIHSAALNSKGQLNRGSGSVWIKINRIDKGRAFSGKDYFANIDDKRRYFVSAKDVTVHARAQAWPVVDSATKKVESKF